MFQLWFRMYHLRRRCFTGRRILPLSLVCGPYGCGHLGWIQAAFDRPGGDTANSGLCRKTFATLASSMSKLLFDRSLSSATVGWCSLFTLLQFLFFLLMMLRLRFRMYLRRRCFSFSHTTSRQL